MAYHHGNLKPALLAAAVEILDEQGVAGLTLRAVARRTGVSRQAPYNHFRDADHLIAAVAEEAFEELLGLLTDRWCEGGDERALQDMGVCYVRFAVDNPGRFRVMFGPQLRRRDEFPELARAADRVFTALSRPPAALLGDEVEQTASRPADRIPPEDARVPLWSVVHGLSYLLVDGQLTGGPPGAEAAEAFARATTKALWFGLAGGRV